MVPSRPAWSGYALLALFILLEFFAIWWFGRSRYAALPQLGGVWYLVTLFHEFLKLCVPALGLTLGILLIRPESRAQLFSIRPSRPLLYVNIAAALGLILLQNLMPYGRVSAGANLSGLRMVYPLAIVLFALVLVTTAALLVPVHRVPEVARERLRRQITGLVFAVGLPVALFGPIRLLMSWSGTSRPFGGVIEDVTLSLSLYFYSMTGLEGPDIMTAPNGDPILVRNGFAVQMAPECAGYQGMTTAVIALLIVMALSWRRLHITRAVGLAIASVGLVFVMNAVRIATLLYIGINVSEEVALNGFHSHFGTVSLLIVLAGAILLMQHPFFARSPSVGGTAQSVMPNRFAEYADLTPLLLPLAIMLFVSFSVGTLQGEFNWLYFVPAFVGATLIWLVRGRILPELTGSPSVFALAAGVIVYVLWIALIPHDPERSAMFDANFDAASTLVVVAWIAVRVVGSSVVVPVLEELAFRAGLQRIVERAALPFLGGMGSMLVAVLVSSIAFGVMHADILAATLAGLVYGALAAWRGRIGDAIVAHAVTNFLISVHVLALAEWSYW